MVIKLYSAHSVHFDQPLCRYSACLVGPHPRWVAIVTGQKVAGVKISFRWHSHKHGELATVKNILENLYILEPPRDPPAAAFV